MKVLVTGATGLIGRAVVNRLVQQGHTAVILTRNPGKARNTLPFASEVYCWVPEKESPPEKSFHEVTAVIHLAGEPVGAARWTPMKKNLIYESRIFGTRNLITGLKRFGKQVEVLVCASATGYYGDRGEEPLTESDTPGTGFLAKVVIDWEREVYSDRSLGFRRATLRTGIALSDGGGVLEKLAHIFRWGLGAKLGTGNQWLSWVHVDDLAALYVDVITRPQWQGPINAVTPHPVRSSEFTEALSKALRRRAILSIPRFALRIMLGEMSQLLLYSQKVTPDKAIRQGYTFRYPSLDMAFRNLLKY